MSIESVGAAGTEAIGMFSLALWRRKELLLLLTVICAIGRSALLLLQEVDGLPRETSKVSMEVLEHNDISVSTKT